MLTSMKFTLPAILVFATMLVGDPTWAAGVSDFFRSQISRDIRDLSVPTRLGVITDRWAPARVSAYRSDGVSASPFTPTPRYTETPTRPLVVLIQDLHANIGVQKNIAGILEHLYNRFGISSFYMEAAFGPCDVSLYRTLSSRRAQKAASGGANSSSGSRGVACTSRNRRPSSVSDCVTGKSAR